MLNVLTLPGILAEVKVKLVRFEVVVTVQVRHFLQLVNHVGHGHAGACVAKYRSEIGPQAL